MDGPNTEVQIDVIVLGAGISGVVTAKCMQDAGFNVRILERTGDVGGLWTFKEKGYGVMKFTHINVTKHNYCFSDFPFPEGTPDYPHNVQMARYIENYTKHFGIDKLIQFHTQVNEVEKKGKQWVVHTERVEESEEGVIKPGGEKTTYICQFVAVATGHHAKPVLASFPGQDTFTGKLYHSVEFNDAISNGALEKKVVVVGIGNSAVDAACNCASAGRSKPVYISTRSGAWVVPNYIFGHPTDLYACRLFLWLPWRIGTLVFEKVISLVSGSPFKWGLNPKMHALQTQPTVSPTLVHHIQRQEIIIKPNIKSIEEKEVCFTDGSKVEADHIIMCTGYKIDLPFLSDSVNKTVLEEKTNDLKLYKNVFNPELGHTMAFIGFVQPASGGVLTMSEMQARWWAELCRNNVKLPERTDMEHNIKEEMDYVQKRWFHSSRHTIQRDPILYNDDLGSFIGCKPEFTKHPLLAWRLLVGSCGSAQYRLQGPGQWAKATEEVKKVPVTGFLLYGTIAAVVLVMFLCYYLFGGIMDCLEDYFGL